MKTANHISFFRIEILLLFFLFIGSSHAQNNVVTAGFHYKPIFSSSLFKTGSQSVVKNNINITVKPMYGYCAGMIIRRGLTDVLSVETGINFVKRNYRLGIADTTFKGESEFGILGYEVPVSGLVFIRLGNQLFMDASFGASMDIFPSDIYTHDSYFKNYSVRRSWLLISLIANIGYEYRTAKIGYFYLGASFHRPFNSIYNSKVEYLSNNKEEIKLSGNYLTIDFRYFFHEDPLKFKKKKK